MTAALVKVYSVSLWGSHPDAGNDDCWTGDDFATLDEALTAAFNWRDYFPYQYNPAFIEIDGPDYHEDRANQDYRKPRNSDDGEWKREAAMQAGMAFGCDGYNDEMGS